MPLEIGVSERAVGVLTREKLRREGEELARRVKAALLGATDAGLEPHEALLALVSATAKASWDAGFTKDFFFQFAGAVFDQLKRQVDAGATQLANGWKVDRHGNRIV